MQAKTKLAVEDGMLITVSITMTIHEMRVILANIDANSSWPVAQLKSVFSQSLRLASQSYDSEQDLAT